MLQRSGWQAGRDRVERIWRREGLKVPQKQRPRRRLWLNDGSCIRLRPERANHVWSYDFVNARTHDGRLLRILALIDEYTRECLALRVARRLNSQDVIETLSEVMLWRGIPEHIRSGNGPEFVARQLRDWLRGTPLGLADLLDVLRDAPRLTGWNTWWVPTRQAIKPYPSDGAIECWLGGDTSEHHQEHRDADHSDFWRITPDGRAFLLRGY